MSQYICFIYCSFICYLHNRRMSLSTPTTTIEDLKKMCSSVVIFFLFIFHSILISNTSFINFLLLKYDKVTINLWSNIRNQTLTKFHMEGLLNSEIMFLVMTLCVFLHTPKSVSVCMHSRKSKFISLNLHHIKIYNQNHSNKDYTNSFRLRAHRIFKYIIIYSGLFCVFISLD